MSNIWIVAKTEFAQIVRTKAFIASLVMLPLMIAITVGLQTLVAAQERGKPYRVVVIDETQQLYPQLMAAAVLLNAANATSISPGPRLELFEEKPPAKLEELKLSLSEKIRNKDLEAFIVLPAGLLSQPSTVKAFAFHADETKYSFTGWFSLNINQALFLARLSQNGIKPERLQEIAQPTEMERAGLFKLGSAGEIQKTDTAEDLLQIILPMGLMIVLFLLVMMSTQPLLSTVLEEKMSRISEVLLGLVNPFELMMGKLIGSLGASLILALLYVGTGGALMVLTVITVLATKIDLGGNINLALAMAIAAVKATLVVLFFMHLKYDKVFHSVLFVGGVLAAALFVGFALMDSGQYQETIQWDTNNPVAAPIGPRPIVK